MLCDFPTTLQKLRRKKGLSQRTVAKDLGISPALLSHYENGIRECGLDFLLKLSEYYGVSCDYLLGKTDKEDFNADDVEERAMALNEILQLAKKHNPALYEKLCTVSDIDLYRLVRLLCDNAVRSETFTFEFDDIDYKNFTVSAETAIFAELSGIQKEKRRLQSGEYDNVKKSIVSAEKDLKKKFGKVIKQG